MNPSRHRTVYDRIKAKHNAADPAGRPKAKPTRPDLTPVFADGLGEPCVCDSGFVCTAAEHDTPDEAPP